MEVVWLCVCMCVCVWGGDFLRKSIKSLINVKRRWETGRSPPRGKPIKKVSLPQTLVCLVASPSGFSFYQSHIPGGEVFMRRDPKHNPGPLWVFPKESLNKTFIHLPCFLKSVGKTLGDEKKVVLPVQRDLSGGLTHL